MGSVTGFAAFRPIKFANKKIRQIFISVSRNIENLTLTVRLKLIWNDLAISTNVYLYIKICAKILTDSNYLLMTLPNLWKRGNDEFRRRRLQLFKQERRIRRFRRIFKQRIRLFDFSIGLICRVVESELSPTYLGLVNHTGQQRVRSLK